MKYLKLFENFINESKGNSEELLQSVMDYLAGEGFDNYPGGDWNNKGPWIELDNKKQWSKAQELLKKGGFKINPKTEKDGNDLYYWIDILK